MASLLNPQAPEYFPTQQHKLQNFPTSIFTPHQQRYYYYYYSHAPFYNNHPFFYPITTIPPPSTPPFHHATVPEPRPTRYDNVGDEPKTLELFAPVHTGVPKGEVVSEAKMNGDSKGFVQKRMFKALVSCGTVKGRCRSDGLRHKGYSPRKIMRGEGNGQLNKVDSFRNRHVPRIAQEQFLRSSPKNKRCYPLMPVNVDGGDTTVMIRNIPSKYTREMLVEFLDDHCLQLNLREKEAREEKGDESCTLAFDFVYLPIDFRSGMNKGYAFVNFTKPEAAWKFLLTASNMKWGLFHSHKIREVVSARLQGKTRLEKHFETMNFPCDSEDVLPLCFSPPRDGLVKGEQRTVGKLKKRYQL